jgi:hypothetical protein
MRAVFDDRRPALPLGTRGVWQHSTRSMQPSHCGLFKSVNCLPSVVGGPVGEQGCSQLIPKHTRVWQFTPGFDLDLDPSELERQPAHFRATMLHYGYIDPRRNRFILCCDDYRFMNHSDTPNVEVHTWADPHGIDYAARDIEAGEEVTVDYRIVDGVRP